MAGLTQRLMQGAGLSVVKLAAGLAKVKVIAVLLGVEGMGVLSLVLQFQTVAVAVLSMGISAGVINLARPLWTAGRVREAGGVVGTALVLVLANAAVLLVAFGLFHDFVRETVFSGHLGTIAVWPVVAAAVLAAVCSSMWEAFFFLTNRFELYVRTGMAAAVLDAAAFALGATLWGLEGAIAAALISAVCLFALYAAIALRARAERPLLAELHWQPGTAGPLLSYSALMLSTTAVGSVCLLAARATVTGAAGADANGLLQVPIALASYLLPFITNGVHGHLYPLASGQGDTPRVRQELKGIMRASAVLALFGCIGVAVSAPIVVPLVYTRDFMGAWPFMRLYFAGEFFFILATVYGIYLLAIGQKRAYLIGVLGYHLTLLAGVALAAGRFGAWAYVGAHVAGAVGVSLAALVFAMRRRR